MIKFPPIKQQPLPEYLIFKTRSSPENSPFLRYSAKIFSLKDGKVKGKSIYRPFEIERKQLNDSRVKSMYVDYLYINDRKQGYGTKLLNYIKSDSYEKGYNGRFHVWSSSVFFPNNSPHVFYRKYGMTTENIETDALIDKFAKKNKTMTYKDLDDLFMYYPNITPKHTKPLKKEAPKISGIKNIYLFFKNLIIKN